MYGLESALKSAREGGIEEWVHGFLLSEGKNKPFSDGLRLEKRSFFGPCELSLDLLSPTCGPWEGAKFRVCAESFAKYTEKMAEAYKNGWDMPPLIANFAGGAFELNDGNHRFAALRLCGVPRYFVIVWTTGDDDANEYCRLYC